MKAVVVLLCVLALVVGCGTAKHKSKKWYEVDLPTDDLEDGSLDALGQSPWLEGYATQQAPPPDVQPEDENLEHHDMSVEEAKAILAGVEAAAKLAKEAGGRAFDALELGVFTGTAHMGAGFMDTAADAAGMQFVGLSSPADLLQESFGLAPPYQQALSPAPAPAAAAAAAQARGMQAAHVASVGASVAADRQLPRLSEPSLAFTNQRTPPPAPPMLHAPAEPPAAVTPARAGDEAQLPSLDLEDLALPTPAPPFVAPDAAVKPPATAAPSSSIEPEQQQRPSAEAAQPPMKVSLMGRGLWTGHGKVSFPVDPEVPPAWGNYAPAAFCNPEMGLEPTDSGGCVCMQGYGTNADMRTCSRCPVGWYSRGGQVGVAFCKPCPQLSTSNPSRTACVARRNVIRPDVAASLCEPCVIPSLPFAPPTCCGRGQVCCGTQGCCPTKRCINNATTNFQPRCCGDDCNIGQSLNCCPGGQICVNITGAQSQSCCLAGNVCGDTTTKSCCNTNQQCCGNRDCCNVGPTASPAQTCAQNNVTGPPQNDLRCCLTTQINCNGTCCLTLDSPPSQRCLVDATGIAQCCNIVQLCTSQADGITQCCSQSGQVCTRNITTTGQQVSRCCPAGYSLCPKNSFQPICCIAGKCPSPSSPDNCLP